MRAPGNDSFRHTAFLFRSQAEYQAGVCEFLRDAATRGQPALCAVPGPAIGLLREGLGADARRVVFADMTALGRNPGRIIPYVSDFAASHPGQPISYVGQPAWSSRSPPEYLEAAKHEALVNQAFPGMPITFLCPYDAAALPPEVLATARQTHPQLTCCGRHTPSPSYLGPTALPPACQAQLPQPPPGAATLHYHTELHLVRELTQRSASKAALPGDRAADLVIAVGELAANTVAHAPAGGTLRIWQTPGELICQISDDGWITDPLAGHRRRPPDDQGGHGLWLVNQVCDLVETRSSRTDGTTTRLHMTLSRQPQPGR